MSSETKRLTKERKITAETYSKNRTHTIRAYRKFTDKDCYTQKMLALMFLFLINFYAQHQNYQNNQFHLCYKIKQPNAYLHLHIHQGLLHKSHPLSF